jgi:hypothetical protein
MKISFFNSFQTYFHAKKLHAGIDGKKLTWDLQVDSIAISVKLMWIKAEKPVEKTGQDQLRTNKQSDRLIYLIKAIY